MRALSIRQPYAEMILRGEKTIEYRLRPTRIIGERFYIYASRKWAGVNGHAVPAPTTTLSLQRERESMPTGVIVGTAVISHVTNGGTGNSAYEWHLTNVKRMRHPQKPKGRPQPVWFNPF